MMLTLQDVTVGRRRRGAPIAPDQHRDQSVPTVAPLHALEVPATLGRSERMQLDEALAKLGDDDLLTLHETTKRTLDLTQRSAANYTDLERGLAFVVAGLGDRGVKVRKAGRRTDPVCTQRERLIHLCRGMWRNHIVAAHQLIERAQTLVTSRGLPPAAAAHELVAIARSQPAEFGRLKSRTVAEWPQIQTAVEAMLTEVETRRRDEP